MTKQRQKSYYIENRDRILARIRAYRATHREKQRDYYLRNKERILSQTCDYTKSHPEIRKKAQNRYNTSPKGRLAMKRWAHTEGRRPDRMDRRRALARKRDANGYSKIRYQRIKASPERYLRMLARHRIKNALKAQGVKRTQQRTLDLLGCTLPDLKKHVESKFLPGMTWENRGAKGWHLDHIKPLCLFKLSDPDQRRDAFHYTNIQPLWWSDNLSKGKSYPRHVLC